MPVNTFVNREVFFIILSLLICTYSFFFWGGGGGGAWEESGLVSSKGRVGAWKEMGGWSAELTSLQDHSSFSCPFCVKMAKPYSLLLKNALTQTTVARKNTFFPVDKFPLHS